MPLIGRLAFVGTVAPQAVPTRLAFDAHVIGGGKRLVIDGTVSRDVVESYAEKARVGYGQTIELDGVDVTADVAGPVQLADSIDQSSTEGRIPLHGAKYAPLRTISTWTRTPVRITWLQGLPGRERSTLELNGYVRTCDQTGPHSFELTVSDAGELVRGTDACYELEPHSGRSRGTIAKEIGLSAGITEMDVPAGAVLRKSVQVQGDVESSLFEFGKPEGWRWRWRPDDVLEAYQLRLKSSPEPPDYIWHLDDLITVPTVDPPDDVPSRWVMRATTAATIDELGIETTVTDIELTAPYTPKFAVERQATDGSRSPVTGFGQAEQERVVSRIRITDRSRGSLFLSRRTQEWGWFAPSKGKLTTGNNGAGNGPGPRGTYFTDAWIFDDGSFRAWPVERFVQILDRLESELYDGEQQRIGSTTITDEWHRRPQAVGHTEDQPVTVLGTYIGDDDESYAGHAAGQIDFWDKASEHVTTVLWGESGAEQSTRQESFGWRGVPSSLDLGFALWSGRAQETFSAQWGQIEARDDLNIVNESRQLIGKIESEEAWRHSVASGGQYDWGADERSWMPRSVFGLVKRRVEAINARGGIFERIRFDGPQRQVETFIGDPPLPRFQTSPWTRLVSEQIEVVRDEGILESWFGRRVRALSSEWAQTSQEAKRVLDAEIAREAAHQATVERHDHPARPGDTVLLIDEERGLIQNFLVVGRERIHEGSMRRARFYLEVPVL